MPKIQISKTKMTQLFDERALKKFNVSKNRDLSHPHTLKIVLLNKENISLGQCTNNHM